ncbi:MAG TPA: sugar phosphate nucleotidyltransferase [Pyrinomonadaceae bacterium]|nr:sugar phosphate nucleotidyltransferase [Pyrinomonadaceae bacterium]
MIRHAIIMAAGRGMRMAPLTDAIPKPMAPYNGTTLIARGISRLAEKIEHIHVTVGYKKAMLAQHVIEHGASTVFNTEGKSNCWWVYNTLLKSMDEPMFVLTCDNVVDLDFAVLEENYLSLNSPPCMLVPVRPVPGLEGDFVFHREHLVTEISRQKQTDIYCSGIQVLNPARLNEVTNEGESFYDVWRQLIASEQLFVSSVYPKKWFAVDTIEQLTNLNKSPF